MKKHIGYLLILFFGLIVLSCSDDDTDRPDYGTIRLVAEFENPDPNESLAIIVRAFPAIDAESIVTYQNDNTTQTNQYSKSIDGLSSGNLIHTFSSEEVTRIDYSLQYGNKTEENNIVEFTVFLDDARMHTHSIIYEPGEIKVPSFIWSIDGGFSQN